MTTFRRLAAVTLAGVALAAAAAAPAGAHPLGNFTTNTSALVSATRGRLAVDYVVDLAEVPAFREQRRMQDGEEVYAARMCARLATGIDVAVDGVTVELASVGHAISFPDGEAGLRTLRLECSMAADAAVAGGAVAVRLRDRNFPDRVGWREIVVGHDESVTDRLTSYPDDRLSSPLRQLELDATVPVAATVPSGAARVIPEQAGAITERFTSLVAERDLTAGFAAVAFAVAIGLGALHSLAPGHGKTVMTAYLVGQRGAASQAAVLALTVAVTHTAGVLLLGLLLTASESVVPEQLYPGLGVASGVLFAAIGVGLVRRSFRARTGGHHHHGHHDHGHHRHGHHHHHDHDHHGHDHDHAPAPAVSWRRLVGPGVAGGLVPTPSALVVLLGGVALGRTWFGVLLVVGYGVGMACTLVAIGWLLVRLRVGLEGRVGWARAERLAVGLPVVTGVLVVAGGVALAARSAGVA